MLGHTNDIDYAYKHKVFYSEDRARSYTGACGQISVLIIKDDAGQVSRTELRLHDGVSPGGVGLAGLAPPGFQPIPFEATFEGVVLKEEQTTRIKHWLSRYPAVRLINQDGTLVVPTITYPDKQSFTLLAPAGTYTVIVT